MWGVRKVRPITPGTNGWRDALKERGVTVPDPIIVPDDDLEESVKAGRTLGRRGDVTAIFAGNDETAIAVIRGSKGGWSPRACRRERRRL